MGYFCVGEKLGNQVCTKLVNYWADHKLIPNNFVSDTPLAFPADPVTGESFPVAMLTASHPFEAVVSICPAIETLYHMGLFHKPDNPWVWNKMVKC